MTTIEDIIPKWCVWKKALMSGAISDMTNHRLKCIDCKGTEEYSRIIKCDAYRLYVDNIYHGDRRGGK